MHIDFALPVDHDLAAGFAEWKRKAGRSVMDYGFHMAVTSWSPKVDASALEHASTHVALLRLARAAQAGPAA
jgi:dihydroorotase-like cyclic amidohydrolase